MPPLPADPEAEARRLLVEANLNRLRGDYDAAEALCRQAIARSAQNPAAWTLLGDVCAAQGRTDSAADAYRTSLSIADDPMLRARLDELLSSQPAERPADQAPAARPEDAERRTARRTLVFVALAVIIGGAAILAAILLSGRSNEPAKPHRAAPAPTGAGVAPAPGPEWRTAAPPAFSRPVASAPGGAVRTIPSPRQATAAEPLIPRQRPVGTEPRDRQVINVTKIRSPLTNRERTVVYEISKLPLADGNPIGNRYCSAMINPGSEHIVITFEVPPEVTASPTRSFILSEARRLAIVAARADERFQSCAVRVVAGWTSPKTGARRLDVVFIGQTDRAILTQVLAVPADRRRNVEVFKSVWWNPSVGK